MKGSVLLQSVTPELMLDLDNGTALCESCHIRVHHDTSLADGEGILSELYEMARL